MIVNDVWGTIKIEPKYETIIESKEFIDLKNKTQLGLNCNPNAIHTRYQHSIGTYFLACKLIDICKNKFSEILNINKEDEEAIKCMALIHDIGHGCFSHVSEKFLEGTHENRTVTLLLNQDTEIHQAIINSFGENVLLKIVDLIKMKETIKDNQEVTNDNSLMLIIGKLLSGGIDIDRIDYIFRDSKFINGEDNDFSNILESINLENIDDSLEVVFNSDVEYAIANFFNKRFELYDSLYLDNEIRVLEDIFGKFLKETGIKLNWNTTEIEMNNYFREYSTSNNPIVKRYSTLLINRKLDNQFIIKEIDQKDKYDYYLTRLFNSVPELNKYKEFFFQSNCKVSIYNKDNKIYVNKDGLILDISDSSKILNSELKKEKYVLAIDIYLLRILLKLDCVSEIDIDKIVKNLKKVTAVEIEQEKKYNFSKNLYINPKEGFERIANCFGLTNPKYIVNCDTYYDDNNILEGYRIAVRRRISNGKSEWTIKRPLNDMSSISKRDEKNFTSLEDALLFLQKEWNIPITELTEKITLNTQRIKYDLTYGAGLFEMVFDKTTPIVSENMYEPNFMIECELKQGNSSGLYFINEIIKRFDFIEECKYSKKEIALNSVKNNLINYDDKVTEPPETISVMARKLKK